MPSTAATIRKYFSNLGLEREVADLYWSLHRYGPQTISELSRTARVERTRIYRLLETLQSHSLVEVDTKYKHSLISPAPIANLQILINQRLDTVKRLQADLPVIQNALNTNPASSPATRIQYYRGPQGLRQILWNELRSTSEIWGYSYQIFDEGVGRSFMTNWVKEFEHRELRKYIMFNDRYFTSWHNRPGTRIKGIEYHYIDPEALQLGHTCNVYDDVTCYLNWKDGEVFGLEIYNRDIADVQRQLLRGIWPLSQPETRF